MRSLNAAARQIALYRYGLLAAVFLTVASLTCGIRTGAELPQETLEGIVVALSVWKVLGLILWETLCVLALVLAAMHPFGCALCAVLLIGKSFAVGYSWGWWMARFGWIGIFSFVLTMLPQGILSLGAYVYGGCVTSYQALRVCTVPRREYFKLLLAILILQGIAVFLRCIGCAWAG